ncbi:MAG: four helix bundle protein [Bacteroidales bacterium]|nr:four helix bundle protein [Bacteroidales bacterium]
MNSFEDIKAWQNARKLVVDIYKATKQQEFSRDYGLKDQIQRTAVSVMSNIAEGYERNSKKEFIRFLYISRGSAGEVRSLLYVANDLNYIDKEFFDQLSDSVLKISCQIYRLIEYLSKEKQVKS